MPKNTPTINHTFDEKKEITEKVCELYSSDSYTLESCCQVNGIALRTFQYWVERTPELNLIYRNAIKSKDTRYKQNIRERAKTLIEKRLEGMKVTDKQGFWEEVATGEIDENGNGIRETRLVRSVATEKTVYASDTLLIFVMSNTNADNNDEFKRNDMQVNQIAQQTIQNNSQYNLDNVSTETLERLMLEMENNGKT